MPLIYRCPQLDLIGGYVSFSLMIGLIIGHQDIDGIADIVSLEKLSLSKIGIG